MRSYCLWTITKIFMARIYIRAWGHSLLLNSVSETEMKAKETKKVLKRQHKWADNSPYFKSMHKYWITEEISVLFYSIHLKWLLITHVFLILFFPVWNASMKSCEQTTSLHLQVSKKNEIHLSSLKCNERYSFNNFLFFFQICILQNYSKTVRSISAGPPLILSNC